MKKACLLSIFVCLSYVTFSQSSVPRRVKKFLVKQDQEAMAKFPDSVKAFPDNSLGFKLQEEFKMQAANSCGINRPESKMSGYERNFIPRDIFNKYGEPNLRLTGVQPIKVSATNILFLSLKDSDIAKFENGSFSENEYIQANRVIGLSDNFVDYGSSYLNPIDGFPSYTFQKSCGSYFSGNMNAGITFPIAEMKTSMEAETEKKSLITSISGKFFSPLYLILAQSGKRSIYAHMLIWQLYAEDEKNATNTSGLLFSTGKYISEFDATLIKTSTDRDQNLSMIGRIGGGMSAGIFNVDGSIKSGLESKESFSMVGFTTLIHKASDRLRYTLTRLPSHKEISDKLQTSFSYSESGQKSAQGIATHLLPFTISRVMAGIPVKMCENNSWVIDTWDNNVWQSKPSLKSFPKPNSGDLPDCICEITGQLKPSAITAAQAASGYLNVELEISHTQAVNGQKLAVFIKDPSVKISKGPSILDINENSVNASSKNTESAGQKYMEFPISLIVDDGEVAVKSPLEILSLTMEYINSSDTDKFLTIARGPVNGKKVDIIIKTKETSTSSVKTGELTIPVKLKMRVRLANNVHETVLVSNTVNLRVPSFAESQIDDTGKKRNQ